MHFLLRIPGLAILITLLYTRLLLAAPTSERRHHVSKAHRDTKPDLSQYQVPLSNGSMSLPSPSGTLKGIILGRGTQNYTCNGTTTSPTLVGAKASLTDISPLLPFMPPDSDGTASKFLSDLPAIAYKIESIIQIINKALDVNLDVVGKHIFNALGTPCFDLGDLGSLEAKKLPGGDMVAPAGAIAESVNWLALGDAGGSKGLKGVYRVNTAGGKPDGRCDGSGKTVTLPYTVLYYFYA